MAITRPQFRHPTDPKGQPLIGTPTAPLPDAILKSELATVFGPPGIHAHGVSKNGHMSLIQNVL
jgi:hypothetical protein